LDVSGVLRDGVLDELQRRRQPDAGPAAHLGAQHALGALQRRGRRLLLIRASVTVTKPRRGSLIRFSRASATISRTRSASLRARAPSLTSSTSSRCRTDVRRLLARASAAESRLLVLVIPHTTADRQKFQ